MSRTRSRLNKVALEKNASEVQGLSQRWAETGALGKVAQAAAAGIKEASEDSRHYRGVQKLEKVSSISDLYTDPEQSRQHRLNTLLRRY
jgi:hypothetical protein